MGQVMDNPVYGHDRSVTSMAEPPLASRSSITTKGLLVLAVPVIFQVCFVFLFIHLQSEAELEARKAFKARELSEHLNETMRDMYRLYQLFAETRHYETIDAARALVANYKNGFLPILQRLKKEYADLEWLSATQPELHETIMRSAQSMDKLSGIVSQAYTTLSSGSLMGLLPYAKHESETLRLLFGRMISQEFMVAAEQEKNFADSSFERQQSIRRQMVQAMLIMCAFNVASCTVMAVFLFKGIISRLDVLRDNARRIASSEPLNPRLSGNDELADLDGAVHRMAQSLEESARTKQEIFNMLTHDLRTPLAAIKGSLEMLEAGKTGELGQSTLRIVTLAQRNSDRMMTLINDLLDVEKIKAGMITLKTDRISVQDLLDDAAENVQGWLAEHGVKIEVECANLYVQVDEDKIARVLANLVANAMRYSCDGKTIQLSAKAAGDGFVVISVRDEGIGIAKEFQETIFERFHQAKSIAGAKQSGSGLGLTICRALVDMHGGKIWVVSEEGKGSTFQFTVPVAKESSPA